MFERLEAALFASGLVNPDERRLRASIWTVLATLGIVLGLQLLFRRGMFFDGALYATIARNLAQGLGDPWHPQVTATFMNSFREHPPLAFWLQAIWFRALGDHLWVERAYSISSGVTTAVLIVGIWRRLFAERPKAQLYAWLPVTLWLACSCWPYFHNMLENTLGVFTALSVYATLRATGRERWAPLWSLVAGVSVTAAVLTKGPVGFFPLVAPGIACLTLRHTSRRAAAGGQLLLLCACLGSLAALLSIADCRDYLTQYWQQQVVASLSGQREGTSTLLGHCAILVLLGRVIVIPLGIGGLLLLAARLRRALSAAPLPAAERGSFAQPGWFCLLMALSASLPLILSPKQAGHYAAPSYPLFALAVSVWCLPAVLELAPTWAKAMSQRSWLALRWGAVFVVAVAALQACIGYGSCSRNRWLIETADEIATRFPPHSIVFVTPAGWERLDVADRLLLHTYLYRYHFVSLSALESQPSFLLEFNQLKPLSPGWVVSEDQVTTAAGLTCSAVVRRPMEMTAGLPSVRR